ncbi:MAG TPA: hypothetical protein VGF76_10270 [Polyangiaceae bacterium]|jgi:hypothetical protein
MADPDETTIGAQASPPGSPPRPVFFLATPLLDGRVHQAYLAGALQMTSAAPGQLLVSTYAGSFLPVNRDILTARFLRSHATHMLCIDSDIGWGPGDVEKLLKANQDFMSGIYSRKQPDGAPASVLLDTREGELIECLHAAAGFLLLTRACVERMVLAYPELAYKTPVGPAWALWSPTFSGKPYGEDTSFCARWRALGGRIWAHSQVVLKHYGETVYLPRGFGEPEPPSK